MLFGGFFSLFSRIIFGAKSNQVRIDSKNNQTISPIYLPSHWLYYGRANRIRTCDLPPPRRTRYQAALWPEILSNLALLKDKNKTFYLKFPKDCWGTPLFNEKCVCIPFHLEFKLDLFKVTVALPDLSKVIPSWRYPRDVYVNMEFANSLSGDNWIKRVSVRNLNLLIVGQIFSHWLILSWSKSSTTSIQVPKLTTLFSNNCNADEYCLFWTNFSQSKNHNLIVLCSRFSELNL